MPFLDHVLHPFKHTHKEPSGETPFGPVAARRAAAGRGAKNATMASDFTTTSATSTTPSGITTSSSTTISDATMTPVDLSYPASDTGDDASENFRHHNRQRDVDVVEPLHNFHQTKKFEGSEHHHHHGEPRPRKEEIGILGIQDQDSIEFTPKGAKSRTTFNAEDLRRGNLPRDQSILDVENSIPPSDFHGLAVPTEEVKVVLPGTEEQVIVKQVQGPEVTIHQTHIEQPMVHEQHIHKDIVHEHHIVQDVIHERHIEQPIITEKHIEKPVVHEKHIERPIIHEKHYEKEVIHEKHIEQPIIHERHIDKPVMHEQHIVVPIIHEQHIIKPIIHEVHVTQVVTDLVLPTQTSQAQMSAAIAEAASAAIAQAGNSTEPIHIMAPPIVRTADSVAAEMALSTAAIVQTDATQPPPVASQVFDTTAPLAFPGDMSTSSEAAAAVQAACAVPIGAPATTVISRGNAGGVLPASGSIELTSEGSLSGSPDVILAHEEKKASKKDKKKKSRFHFFHKH